MADNNIFIRIKGEADLGDAQKQLRDMEAVAYDLTKQMGELKKAETEELKALEAKIKKSQEAIAAQKKYIEENQLSAKAAKQFNDIIAEEEKKIEENNRAIDAARKKYKDLILAKQDEIKANNQSITSLKQSVNQYNAVQGAGVRLRTQLMAIREEMVKMAESGDTTSKRFVELADRAAELTDTIGDAQDIINILASDTGKLDTALQVGGGLAGAFNAATSAAALLGGESEELQQAFLKVQAALSVLNGLQQLNAVLDKRSAANVKIRLALAKIFNRDKTKEAVVTSAAANATRDHAGAMTTDAGATTAATVATKGFTKALLANPVMIIVAALSALVFGISQYIKKTREAGQVTRDVNKENDRFLEQIDYRARLAQAEGKTWQEVSKIQEEGIKTAMANVKSEIDKLKEKEKLRKEEKEKLKELEESYKEYYRNLQRLYIENRIKETEEQTKANEEIKRLRTKLAMDEADSLQMLASMDKRRREQALADIDEVTKKANESLASLNEKEESANLASYESMLDYRLAMMQKEGASDEEMWNVKYESMMRYLQHRKDGIEAQLGDEAEFSQEMIDINTQMADLQIENTRRVQEKQREELQETINIASEALATLGDIMGEVFGAISDNIQTQMDDLNNLYTTDAEEAKNNANKKYISEKELADKQLKLKQKQAKLDKANALFNIGLSTAMAIMRIWADVPKGDFGASTIAMTILASALGATQLAIAASKPLPKYAKGRKGGQGEYALVGEKGAEIMYIPQGASIIPNNKISDPSKWGAYGVPSLPIPASASMNSDMLNTAMALQAMNFDYDRFGKAVAQNINQQMVSVNVDRNGVTVSSNGSTRTYLNHKYNGSWTN